MCHELGSQVNIDTLNRSEVSGEFGSTADGELVAPLQFLHVGHS